MKHEIKKEKTVFPRATLFHFAGYLDEWGNLEIEIEHVSPSAITKVMDEVDHENAYVVGEIVHQYVNGFLDLYDKVKEYIKE